MDIIDTKGPNFVINIGNSDRVLSEQKALLDTHNDTINFIIESAKQMAAFLQTNHNDCRILRTPSRRTSKRKRSSLAFGSVSTTKKSQTSLKVRDVSAATPRRLTKRTKRSTIKLDTTMEQMEVQQMPETVTPIKEQPVVYTKEVHTTITETFNGHNSDDNMDVVIENRQTIDEKIEIMKDMSVNDVLVIDNKVVTASELMSELTINEPDIEDDNKMNESDNEWMTDDEDCPLKNKNSTERLAEDFYDAVNDKESPPKEPKKGLKANKTVNKSLNSSVNKTLVGNSAAKENRKKTLYFTPQSSQRSTRAQTRMLSRIADSSQKTPQTVGVGSRIKNTNMNTSGETTSSRMTGTSSNRSVRSHSRIQNRRVPNDSKALTDSAMKRRQEAEEQRMAKLLASQEKENRAIEKRRILIEKTVNEKKLKSQEKTNRVAELKERQKLMETERLKKELEKREEWERKREEDRREQIRKRQEEMAQKAVEIERRKQINKMQEIEAKLKKQEDFERKQELEKERVKEQLREQERMNALIQQHNNSLQQKALANSFIKKTESNSQLLFPKVMIHKLSPKETEQHMNHTYNKETVESVKSPEQTNTTFVKEDKKELMSYDMTPPPKEVEYDNYDISGIQSGDDTDDEQQPRKRIPVWARGQQFIQQIHNQFNKSQKEIFREVRHIYGSGDVLLNRFKVEFDLMFPKKPLHPKYAKRTSSAVWEEMPSRYRLDESSINQSFIQ